LITPCRFFRQSENNKLVCIHADVRGANLPEV